MIAIRVAIHTGEDTAEQNSAIQLEGDSPNRVIGPRAGNKGGIQGAVYVQAGDVIVIGIAINRREIAADEDFPIALQSQGINRGISPQTRIETGIRGAVIIQAGNAIETDPADRGKTAAQQNLALTTHKSLGDGINRVIGTRSRIEQAVLGTIRIQAGNIIQGNAVKVGEQAAHENAAVRLYGQGPHRAVGTHGVGGEQERRVQGPIGIHPRNALTGDAIRLGEIAAHNELVIALQRHGIHRIVKAKCAIGRVGGTGSLIHHVAINNIQDGIGDAPQCASRRGVGQQHPQIQRPINLVVLNNRHLDIFSHFATGKVQVRGGSRIIYRSQSGVIFRRKGNIHRAHTATRAGDGNERIATVLFNGINR